MRTLLFLAALTAIPAMAGAQNSRADQEKISESVPVNMLPPAGKCRIWMVGVAPAQQPAPTDCQTALRQRPTNGVVVFGPVEREEGSSAFRGRPTVEQGRDNRARTPSTREPSRATTRESSESRESTRESPRDPARDPARAPTRAPASSPARGESRAPSTDPRRASPARPPSGTPRPTEDPVKKPPTDGASTDNSAIIGALAAMMSAESTS